jgi:hypothetical protein
LNEKAAPLATGRPISKPTAATRKQYTDLIVAFKVEVALTV